MDKIKDINEYIESLIKSRRMGDQVAFHRVMEKAGGEYGKTAKPWPDEMQKAIRSLGIGELYSHQSRAVDIVRGGRHVVVATPTASGKSLVYNLPVLENALKYPKSKSLYLFPLKALAQDQLKAFQRMAKALPGDKPDAAIYDGDTTAWHRKKIRASPPNVLLTNPEMLHLSLLAYHEKWSEFFSGLKIVVVDEVHTYRGVMGSHMALVFRRLLRICAKYGAAPTFVFSSATVANPGELAERLTGLDVVTVKESGAPRGSQHLVFIDPLDGAVNSAILLLKAAMHRELRTIVYTQSRKLAELIAVWAGSRAGRFAHRISPYRAGYLPEERRKIEEGLSKGKLLAVISTSALELGIDIGDLDLCLLVGYPGTIVSTWQRGGRVGRSGQDSALVLIAGEDALDRYFMNNPGELIGRDPEAAVVNPFNPRILEKHLTCAASEFPLLEDEPLMAEPVVGNVARALEGEGKLLRSADGTELYSNRKMPHRKVSLRGSGDTFNIICGVTGESKGEIDGFRAFRETHPGAIYLHNGVTYLVETLDPGTSTVKVVPARVDYYTRVRGNKNTEILEIFHEKSLWGGQVCCGRIKVTDQVTGYERWRIHGKRKLNIVPLDLPPMIFETEGLWFKIPDYVRKETESSHQHFMGGIHALEHAAIGVFPLLVMTDRNDLGGISTPMHEQLGCAAVFIYDAVPGGAGLTRLAFDKSEDLLNITHKMISNCPCENGCPSCVHSPKCGSGNRPIEKESAIFVLDKIKTGPSSHSRKTVFGIQKPVRTEKDRFHGESLHYGVLDIETRRSAREVGGWGNAHRMGVSFAVLYNSLEDRYLHFPEEDVDKLVEQMRKLDLVVGFNIIRFDYLVLKGLINFDFSLLPTLDILLAIHNHLGYRLSLDHIANATLGAQKSADGLQALEWWKSGEFNKIIEYCKKDVEITKDVYLHGREKGYILFKNKAKQLVRIPVKW